MDSCPYLKIPIYYKGVKRVIILDDNKKCYIIKKSLTRESSKQKFKRLYSSLRGKRL